MNKARLEAFTDAILAIIATIMILEFKVPKSLAFTAIFNQFPYLISYAIGYLFIGSAWYNHYYLFTKAKRISRRVFWANNLWLFATSFLPVATAWVGSGIFARGPQTFYAIVVGFWTASYVLLAYTVIKSNPEHPQVAYSIKQTPLLRYLTNWHTMGIQVVLQILALMFFPAFDLVLILYQVIFHGIPSNPDSDKLFSSK